jgi:ribosome maturation factor RimP
LEKAAAERACTIVQLDVDDDNNIEVTIDKEGGADLADCEYVHRAVLAAFDRDIEDYALTVGTAGISSEEADELLANEK